MRRLVLIVALFALIGPAVAGSAPAERGTKRVSAYSNYFTPNKITVSRGTKVTWVVRQGAHNVVGRGFSSSIMSTGRTYSKKFKRGGTYRYVCTLHPGMGGKVTVR
jgi:plastocyanin